MDERVRERRAARPRVRWPWLGPRSGGSSTRDAHLIAGGQGEPPVRPVHLPGVVPDSVLARRQRTVDILAWHDPGTAGVRHLNRELSWLQFNERVLAIAEDPGVPLLERVKFIAIFTSNLDEFFQVRVAGLHEQVAADATGTNVDGMSPAGQLVAIDVVVRELADRQSRLVQDELLPLLRREGIELVLDDALSAEERQHLDQAFEDLVFPVLTPLAVDPAHPFPYISNLSLNLAVRLRDPDGDERFARVKIPPRSCRGSSPSRDGRVAIASCRSRRSSRHGSGGCSPALRSSTTTRSV